MILSTLRNLLSYYETNCKQLMHPEEDSCTKAIIDVALCVLKESIKVYIPLYLILRLLQGKLEFKSFVKDVLRSSLFLVINGPGIVLHNCLLNKLVSVVYKFSTVFSSCIIMGAIAYSIESRDRQRILTPYIVSNCVDSIIRVMVSRNVLPSIPYLDVLLFMLVSGRICGRLSTSPSTAGFNGSVFALLTNPMEIVGRRFPSLPLMLSLYSTHLLSKSPILKIPLLLTAGCVWGLFIGLSYNIVSMAIKRVSKLLSASKGESAVGSGNKRRRRFNMSVPAFLSSYIGAFMLCKHILRNMTPLSDNLSDSIAGLLAGPAISIYRFPSLSLYLFIKELQSLSKDLMHSGYLPRVPYFNIILYVLCCSIQFHCVVFETENVAPSYISFIDTFSGGVVPMMSNHLREKQCFPITQVLV